MSSESPEQRVFAPSWPTWPVKAFVCWLGLLASCGQGDLLFGGSGQTAPTAAALFGVAPYNGTSEPDGRKKEYKVKAALLLNFLKYAKFPPKTFPKEGSPIKVLIIGDDPFGPILEKVLRKKDVRGRSIQILRVRKTPKIIDAQLVFTSGLDKKERAALIKTLMHKPTLLVGETAGFAEAGGFINLYMYRGKVRFEINSARQKSTKITLKAGLLKLARIVKSHDIPGPEDR